mgnify:FL=1
MLWHNIETTPLGNFRPCCLIDDEIKRSDGTKYTVNDDIAEVFNSDYMKSLRKSFIADEKPDICKACWRLESSNIKSKRQIALDKYKDVIGNMDTITADTFKLLDLKLGNICNLKCRICGPYSSSQMATELLKLIPAKDRKASNVYEMQQAGQWPRKQTKFWDNLQPYLDQIRFIEFTGGEPFMIKEHFEFLQKLQNKSEIEIHYNTNGTHYPEKYIDIWKDFKTVEIAFSIDDIGGRFEYQRKGAKWSEVEANIRKFKELRMTQDNIQLQCCSTVNQYNAYYLPELSRWIDIQEFNNMHWNMLHYPDYLSVFNASIYYQALLSAKWHNEPCTEPHRQKFMSMLQSMEENESLDDHDNEKFIAHINKMDKLREERFSDCHGEIWDLLMTTD